LLGLPVIFLACTRNPESATVPIGGGFDELLHAGSSTDINAAHKTPIARTHLIPRLLLCT
jgi:hypothetical protein